MSELAISGPTSNQHPYSANSPQFTFHGTYSFFFNSGKLWLYLPLAVEGAWRGRGGIVVTVLLVDGEGLLGCGMGMRRLLPCLRAHLNTAS